MSSENLVCFEPIWLQTASSWQMRCNAWGAVLQLCMMGEEDHGRIKGGKAGGANRVEEEAPAKRTGLALHRREQKEERKSLRHSIFVSTHLSDSTFFNPPFVPRYIWTHCCLSFSALLDSSPPPFPDHALNVLWSFHYCFYFLSFHSSLSLCDTFFLLVLLCLHFSHLLFAL